MLVERLEIEGFRGIESLKLSLDPKLTVIVGENGVGKTSILDALAILLDNYVARWLRSSPQSAERLRDSDIKIGCNTARIAIGVRSQDGLSGEWTLRRQDRIGKLRAPASSEFLGLNALIRSQIVGEGDYISVSPLMIYYGQRRAVLELPRRIRGASKQSPESAFDNALKLGDLNFREFIAWFRDKSLEEAQHWKLDSKYLDCQLEAVRRAMTQATGLKDPSYRVPSPSGLSFSKRGVSLRVDQLSSGERSFLSLAGDLARRLAMLNPTAPDALLCPGIVLIDEVELHLHPRWQRRIMPWLAETFPNCQFVVSTHSPQVLGEIKADCIRVLQFSGDSIVVSEPDASLGRDSNFILLSVLGAEEREGGVRDLLDEFDRELNAGNYELAESMIKRLSESMEGNPPELTLAANRLHRAKRNSKL